uniref:Related to rna binding motif protein n=1 Tax=Melanopsichium pennsylvanicum 4 TaxID=1398559 RepID=A0A077R955_9BASI|nr:related to rna binding motif protein [Melanopsichium pennsylvanicum 4]
MNVVKEIARINKAELDIAIQNPSASWHQQYNDSAYIFIGGLPYDLTEGDVITIFSQYGEIIDVNLPRVNPNSNSISNQHGSPATYVEKRSEQPKPVGKGKHRGFGFLMYEDQRSTVLAVDNLNGTQVLGRTLRVDHVAAYKQPKVVDDEGNKVHADTKIYNAAPQLIHDGSTQNSIDHEADLEDPMAAYLQGKRVEDKGKARVDDEWEKQEKRRRKEERASIRAQRQDRRSKVDTDMTKKTRPRDIGLQGIEMTNMIKTTK